MKLHFSLFNYEGKPKPSFIIGLVPENLMVSSIIMDDYRGVKLLQFIDSVIQNRNERNEYWTNGYTAKVIEKDGVKTIKIFFRLADDYKSYYITPWTFKKIIQAWLTEKEKFDADPLKYRNEIEQMGGEKIINIE